VCSKLQATKGNLKKKKERKKLILNTEYMLDSIDMDGVNGQRIVGEFWNFAVYQSADLAARAENKFGGIDNFNKVKEERKNTFHPELPVCTTRSLSRFLTTCRQIQKREKNALQN
jgi:hypothetical protein